MKLEVSVQQSIKRSDMIFHLVMAAVWVAVIAFLLFRKEQITWVLGVIALSYMALEELINGIWIWGILRKQPDETSTKN